MTAYVHMMQAEAYQRYCACSLQEQNRGLPDFNGEKYDRGYPLRKLWTAMQLVKLSHKLKQYSWTIGHTDAVREQRAVMTPPQKAIICLYRAIAYHNLVKGSTSLAESEHWDDVSISLTQLFQATKANYTPTGPLLEEVEEILSERLGEAVMVHGKLYWSEVRDRVKEICEEQEARKVAEGITDLRLTL